MAGFILCWVGAQHKVDLMKPQRFFVKKKWVEITSKWSFHSKIVTVFFIEKWSQKHFIFIFFIFQKSAEPDLEHSRTVLNYIHMCEGRFFIQVKNILSGLEGWSSADAALEGIKPRCCNCGDRQRVPETYCWGKEGALVGIHGAVRYQESGPVASGCCAGMS